MAESIINRLQQEKSPYLRQHADQPVAWYPWCEEALILAREQDKPILLSIGYSACHWCHVMSAESFSDEAIAEYMNDNFINIKVDREERPDIDKIYQIAFQVMHHQPGGWPLTAMLTPHRLIPFFIGTYFPKRGSESMPGFLEILEQTAEFYQTYHDTIEDNHQPLIDALNMLNTQPEHKETNGINSKPMTIARIEYEEVYDEEHGGFGTSPKFPNAGNLSGLMHYWFLSKHQKEEDKASLTMACHTLEQMAKGGIHDHVGGGFFRYSVDSKWRIPHFEKMLYDNALLLSLYSQMHQCVPSPVYQQVADQLIAWLIRDMRAPTGGFYATLSADSEKEEGKFYLWQRDEIQALLSNNEFVVISESFGLDKSANFHGSWHLCNTQATASIANAMKMSEQSVKKYLQSGLKKLFVARQERVSPNRDEKILTAWNALLVKSLCKHAQTFDNAQSAVLAENCLQFIYDNQWKRNRLYSVYMDGQQNIPGFLDDYAFLLDALIAMLQVKWDNRWLKWATAIADSMIAWFEDDTNGGFYFTPHDQAPLVYRPKPLMEDALPSGNGVAAQALLVLGYLLGNVHYLTVAERTLKMADHVLHDRPSYHEALLYAMDLYLNLPQLVIIQGKAPASTPWKQAAQKNYNPRRFVFSLPEDTSQLPTVLQNKTLAGKDVAAFVCQGVQCLSPITTLEQFKSFLK